MAARSMERIVGSLLMRPLLSARGAVTTTLQSRGIASQSLLSLGSFLQHGKLIDDEEGHAGSKLEADARYPGSGLVDIRREVNRYLLRRRSIVRERFPGAVDVDDFLSCTMGHLEGFGFQRDNSIGEGITLPT